MLTFQHLNVEFSASRCPILAHLMSCFVTSRCPILAHLNCRLSVGFTATLFAPLVGFVCSLWSELFAAFPQIYLWVCRRFICGFPTDLFVGLPQICLRLFRTLESLTDWSVNRCSTSSQPSQPAYVRMAKRLQACLCGFRLCPSIAPGLPPGLVFVLMRFPASQMRFLSENDV